MKVRLICVALILAVMGCFLVSCTPEKQILGTWQNVTEAMGVTVETTYVFEENGEGKLSSLLDITMDFTYAFTDGKLVLTFETMGVKTTEEYEYKFDGDRLLLTADSNTVELNKVK